MLKHDREPGQLLEGTSLEYTYANGSSVSVAFKEGLFHYKWLSGPFKDLEGKEPYTSLKVGDKIYAVNIIAANKSFITLIYNFKEKIMCGAVLFTPCTEQEMTLFESGVIGHMQLSET